MNEKARPFCLFLLFILFSVGWLRAQKCPSPPPYDSLFKRNVYSFVEEQPEYPGGTAALMKYIGQNLVIPANAKELGMEGSASVTFIVESDGSIKDVIPKRNAPYYMDIYIARIIKGMLGWKPGKCNGEPVAVQFSLHISCIKLG
jgi:periplasmic protein TonB